MVDSVVITGCGVTCCLGNTADSLFSALIAGKSGVHKTRGYDEEGLSMTPSAQAHCLDAESVGISQKHARIMNTHSYLLMESAISAYKSARFGEDLYPPNRIGFFAGLGMVDYETSDLLPAVLKSWQNEFNYDTFFTKGYREIYPLWPLAMLNNIAFCQGSITLNLRGDNTVCSPHGESAVYAITEGISSVLNCKSAAVIVGGVSEKVNPQSLIKGRVFEIISKDSTEDALRPFSQKRAGSILGEAGAFVALEPYHAAKKRGIPFISSITGWGFAFDYEDNGFSFPTTEAIVHSMEVAIARSGITPEDVDVVIAHADGTHSDTNEIEAINAVFSHSEKTLVTATTGAIGNTFAATPAINIILADCMIKHSTVPPSLNSTPLDDRIKFKFVTGKPVNAKVNTVLINSLSYEGHASTIIVQRCA
ncbi:beta-ketoacyl-[acyl-carrier-protein] synthase family protein [Candidatus Magnetomonas plexicatena]|uniref:beta-ketoacyl-[acyl-carrier-protein] synthase family protein n=1 Tax=Candidatus Magnetomonas plexicatena TaxID=2552947 RepID=UPI0011033B8E|nr:hypothetical protein E2O03_012910 [Nitrospirales bacterium LBB_01]